MRIGTIRPEEARVFDSFAGYHSFHSEQEQIPHGRFLVFWQEHEPETEESEEIAAGWYWQSGFPGCLPDGDAMGPFANSRAALEDADEWNPEFNPAED